MSPGSSVSSWKLSGMALPATDSGEQGSVVFAGESRAMRQTGQPILFLPVILHGGVGERGERFDDGGVDPRGIDVAHGTHRSSGLACTPVLPQGCYATLAKDYEENAQEEEHEEEGYQEKVNLLRKAASPLLRFFASAHDLCRLLRSSVVRFQDLLSDFHPPASRIPQDLRLLRFATPVRQQAVCGHSLTPSSFCLKASP
nr:hypothetical protein Iba_chr13eCG8540 [Ipomoea batatas]